MQQYYILYRLLFCFIHVDLTLNDITALAREILPYHDTALSMFAEELEVPLIKPNETSIVGAIIIWKEKRQNESDESAKKALARKLMNLDTHWQELIESQHIPEQQKANFKRCARQLDIQGNALFNKYITYEGY